ncbi:hypothetical protein BpHYR1_011555 [Brachionus plicatilis]|uniref:Uncharacterized protein n=1 Tax=Brachionus plicatilis TaxID=10195 RepID=A0A3M7SRG6_BRAPC|nr:hypothetical protein BpHYR1_011555 [Brachionus plicatilis]
MGEISMGPYFDLKTGSPCFSNKPLDCIEGMSFPVHAFLTYINHVNNRTMKILDKNSFVSFILDSSLRSKVIANKDILRVRGSSRQPKVPLCKILWRLVTCNIFFVSLIR